MGRVDRDARDARERGGRWLILRQCQLTGASRRWPAISRAGGVEHALPS